MYEFDFEFFDYEHEHFFHDIVTELVIDNPGIEEMVYLLTIVPEMRPYFFHIFDPCTGTICDDCLNAKWQADKTRRMISMAHKLAHTPI